MSENKQQEQINKAAEASFREGRKNPAIDVRPTPQTNERHREQANKLRKKQIENLEKGLNRPDIW